LKLTQGSSSRGYLKNKKRTEIKRAEKVAIKMSFLYKPKKKKKGKGKRQFQVLVRSRRDRA
jgi:hypothetical protein